MKKQTIIGLTLMTLAVVLYIVLMQTFFAPDEAALKARREAAAKAKAQQAQTQVIAENSADATAKATTAASGAQIELIDENIPAETFVFETELIRAVFSNEGGTLSSFKLKNETNNGEPLEMLPQGETYPAFGMRIGSDQGEIYKAPMKVRQYEQDGKKHIEFSRSFATGANKTPLRLVKTFSFAPEEYLFNLSITLQNSNNEAIALGDGRFAYTLDTGKEIGPILGSSKDGRSFFAYSGARTKTIKSSRKPSYNNAPMSWNSIRGQYFMLAVLPGAAPYTYGYHANGSKTEPEHRISFSRPSIHTSAQTDKLSVYLGPLQKSELARYDLASSNSFGISGAHLSKAIKTGWLGWLERLLKLMLDFFYNIVHNYGYAIILVTIAIKIITYPLTRKSFDSMAKMKDLQPKLKEIQDKYGDNKQKIQEEQMKLYREEQVSPLGGCLPMLIQMPILIAFYTVINTYFPIRGAIFIPGWIMDLSSPESIFAFKGAIPFFSVDGYTHLRALPFIYAISMFLSTKISNPGSPDAAGGMNTKFMTYGFPIMFFFMFYNMSSGLLVYWLFTNIFTILQQLLINKIHQNPEYMARKKAKDQAKRAKRAAAMEAAKARAKEQRRK